MQRDLYINERITIPRGELRFSFARSAGPGGQNVNKLNTKAVLRWSVATSAVLPNDVRRRLQQSFASRLTNDGELVIASDRNREQGRNVADCVERLRAMVLSAASPPRKRRPTRPTRSSNESRLSSKRAHAKKKERRRRPESD
ncbi:Peptidyl-tRNA hydrolase ArfB [Pseudobythopirellula maris]|uniref:Peptidyl-tRNA hydrolase ArfB n=1 Tax=Pseudobythopirellula maris TaxID=2527991 RepID=A0A5C5ZKC0_9BACT|nr:alternative ribosome rescue aminoacyl-tRNA hydrolase ArfB [Pseudobythopirellula maris]TWT87575.1 Peptidyl-tRNA hydrolase ArfB [Pseudobythopirellula maris]